MLIITQDEDFCNERIAKMQVDAKKTEQNMADNFVNKASEMMQ